MTQSSRDATYDAWLDSLSVPELTRRFKHLGVTHVVMKKLSDKQDNSQNQIYWQSELTENPLPIGTFTAAQPKGGKRGTAFKATLNFEWLTPTGTNPAPRAQIVHYPQYPETRLGSLLTGAYYAPRSVLGSRLSAVPNRLLLLGMTDKKVIAVALPPTAPATNALLPRFGTSPFSTWAIVPQADPISSRELLTELSAVHSLGAVAGCKIVGTKVVANKAPNAPGTTLETVLGVRPNSRDEPDFHGWELKAHLDAKVTLMTPAPTGGAIKTMEAEEFMIEFGWMNDTRTRWDFNGSHRSNQAPGGKATTRMVVTGTGVQLVHKVSGKVAMSWSLGALLTHWAKKHSRAAYIRRVGNATEGYKFGPYVQLGEGVSWLWFWEALSNGTLVLDPAYNMSVGGPSMRKARAQFRCNSYELAAFYPTVGVHDLRHSNSSRRLAHANLRAEQITLPPTIEP